MGCHGNHAFSRSPKAVYLWAFFWIQGVPGNNWAPSQNCTWGARLVRLDPGVVGMRSKSVYL